MESAQVNPVQRGHADADRRLETGDQRRQHLAPRASGAFGDRQRHWRQRRARVHYRFGVRVVVVLAVAEDAVAERRVVCRDFRAPPDRRRFARPAPACDQLKRRPAEIDARRAETDADEVEHVLFDFVYDRRRNIVELQAFAELRQSFGNGLGHVHSC
jgi:hypothetical protein